MLYWKSITDTADTQHWFPWRSNYVYIWLLKHRKRTAERNFALALTIRTIIVLIDARPEDDTGWKHVSGMNDVNMQPVLVLCSHGLFECYWIKMFPSLSAQTGVLYVTGCFCKSGAQEPQCHDLTKLGMFCSLLNLHELIGQQMITCWDMFIILWCHNSFMSYDKPLTFLTYFMKLP